VETPKVPTHLNARKPVKRGGQVEQNEPSKLPRKPKGNTDGERAEEGVRSSGRGEPVIPKIRQGVGRNESQGRDREKTQKNAGYLGKKKCTRRMGGWGGGACKDFEAKHAGARRAQSIMTLVYQGKGQKR